MTRRAVALRRVADWPTPIRGVVFDFGETLIDETYEWSAWADWLGVPRFTFMAVFGSVIAAGRPHRDVFKILEPVPGYTDLRVQREGRPGGLRPEDLYPDARPCLLALQAMDLKLGIAGNQPDRAAEILTTVGIQVDLVATSTAWGVAKPSLAFFERVAEELRIAPAEIAYVGDRVDNDVIPAARAGMLSILLRRGPWAWIQAPERPPIEAATAITTLTELPGLLGPLVPRDLFDQEHSIREADLGR